MKLFSLLNYHFKTGPVGVVMSVVCSKIRKNEILGQVRVTRVKIGLLKCSASVPNYS